MNDSVWHKGNLVWIDSDSIFVEQNVNQWAQEKDEIYIDTLAYSLTDFRILAYPKTSRIVGTAVLATSLVAVYVAAAAYSGAYFPIDFWNDEDEVSAHFYEKEINFEEGWYANIMAYQVYCLEFSKEKKKPITIEEGKKISFVIKHNEDWNKGVITKITPDSLFVEQERPKKDALEERESNYEIVGYNVNDFRIVAYTKTSRVVGEGALVLVATAVAAFTLGASIIDVDEEEPREKFFKKNIDFEEGWSAKVVKCAQKKKRQL